MVEAVSFGTVVKERRMALGLTQAELGRRVGCAPITIRKIEADALRPSVQIAEHLAVALGFPEVSHAAFVRFARAEREPSPLPAPRPTPEEIGQEDLSGRAIRGFSLGERLGIGGFGVVYRAVQATVGREVAVKIISPTVADRPEFVRRFEAEAQLVASLEHPYIVPLYDYWREPGGAYLVMRLMRGGDLRTLVKGGPLAPLRVLRLAEQVGAALHAAHRAGVVHRDLKPANILLDDDGNAYLSDFGIARQADDEERAERTQEGAIIGSPAYLAPEQIRAERVSPQTDIYSFGIVLYELFAGRKPYRGPTPVAFIDQHLREPLPPLADGAPTPLEAVIARATAKEPAERYPDALALLADLRLAVDPVAVVQRGDGRMSRSDSPFVTEEVELPDLESPYKGLRPFTEADAADFFGRDQLIQELLARLAESGDLARFLAVVGPSGSGKSSVVRAGLVPALRRGGLPGSDRWFIAELLPGRHPFAELEGALLRIAVRRPAGALRELICADVRGLLRAVELILPPDPAVEALLVIDQLEELFTLVEQEELRAAFLNTLVTAVLDPESRVRIVTTLRADFIDQPLRYVDFGELIRQRTEFVLPLTPDELEQAIVRPAERAGVRLAKGLVATIVHDVGDQPGMLPLLQHSLSELFDRREGRTLTRATYGAIGGVSGSLARRAEELYAGLNSAGQAYARELFLRLVTPGEGTEDTRRRVLRAELEDLGAGKAAGVIDLFGRYRLLTFDRDPLTRGPTVEVAHEALLRAWGRLRQWLNTARADIRQQRLVASAAAEWSAAGRDESFLLRGARLEQVAAWAAASQVGLAAGERAFLDASIAANAAQAASEEARRTRELTTARQLAETESRRAAESARSAARLRRLAYGLAAMLVAAAAMASFALVQRNTAQRNFERAEQVRLAAQAQIALDNGEGGNLPALLALRSLRYGYTPEADAALLAALRRGFARQIFRGHTTTLGQVRISPDGRTALTSSADHTSRLWDARTGQELRRFTHDGRVNNAVFSPDGRFVLTDSADTTVRLWDAGTGAELQRFAREEAESYGAQFSPDGTQIVFGDGVVAILWDIAGQRELRRFSGHTGSLTWIDFSPDGRYLITASDDQTARIWDLAGGQELRQLVGHTSSVLGANFSPDGRYALTASFDRTARLWDVASGAEVQRFVGHTDLLYDAVFSPDGSMVLTSSNDRTARLWDVASGSELRQFVGHTGGVFPSAFSPNGEFVLTGSADRTAKLWDVAQTNEPRRFAPTIRAHAANLLTVRLSDDGHSVLATGQVMLSQWELASSAVAAERPLLVSAANAQALSPEGAILLSAHSDGLVRVWDTNSGAELRAIAGHNGQVWAIAVAADGRMALSGGEDGVARLWDLTSGAELQRLDTHDAIRAAALSPDGRVALTGGEDGIARLWDVAGGQELRALAGHSGVIRAAAFSPDSRLALTGGEDGVARLWEVASGRELRALAGHSAAILAAAFSPDGRYALTGSADQTARLWEVASGAQMRQLVGHSSPLSFVGFSADGGQLLTADAQAAYLWRATMEEVIAFACQQLTNDLSAEERARYEIQDGAPSCASFGATSQLAEAEWTPVPLRTAAAMAPIGTPVPQVVEMAFANESINIGMNMPIAAVYLDAGNGQAMRPRDVSPETLAQPIYRAGVEVRPPLQPPGDAGPFPLGEPLGVTLGEWLAATGRGTYTVQNGEATVAMSFDRLMPNGVYTLWCVEIHVPPAEPKMIERPCGAPDGSESRFTSDENGRAEVTIVIDAFPPPTAEVFYSITLAYHSDGQTHGASVGQHGLNAHAHIFYDFLPPGP